MAVTPESPHPPDSSFLPKPRRNDRGDVAKEVDRAMIVAEAKLLVRQLDDYLLLIGDWATEDGGSGNAEQ